MNQVSFLLTLSFMNPLNFSSVLECQVKLPSLIQSRESLN